MSESERETRWQEETRKMMEALPQDFQESRGRLAAINQSFRAALARIIHAAYCAPGPRVV